MEKIKFKDGTTLDITQATDNGITVVSQLSDFNNVVCKFTKSNLESFQILQTDGTVLSTMEYYKPTGVVTTIVGSENIQSTVGIASISDSELRMQSVEDAINFLMLK